MSLRVMALLLATSMKASNSSSEISWSRESTISNSLGNRLATMRKYSTGFSTRAIFTASSPNSSKSLAMASRSAVLMRSREPFLRPPPLPGFPFVNSAMDYLNADNTVGEIDETTFVSPKRTLLISNILIQQAAFAHDLVGGLTGDGAHCRESAFSFRFKGLGNGDRAAK